MHVPPRVATKKSSAAERQKTNIRLFHFRVTYTEKVDGNIEQYVIRMHVPINGI